MFFPFLQKKFSSGQQVNETTGLQVNESTDGAASGEWSLLQLSRVATEVERSSTSQQVYKSTSQQVYKSTGFVRADDGRRRSQIRLNRKTPSTQEGEGDESKDERP